MKHKQVNLSSLLVSYKNQLQYAVAIVLNDDDSVSELGHRDGYV